ncbi:MAG: PAS domain-containing protein [Spirochaetaceae bacterium]|jgi:signal transduction histidine kinase|nr:PAS domain-containing protein [Spirochaetaceae bacterium]
MRQFLRRALSKLNKLTAEQIRSILMSAANEINRLETVLDSLDTGILVCDTQYRLILANKYVHLLLPIADDSGADLLWHIVLDGMVSEFLAEVLQSGDRIIEREFTVEHKGKLRLLSISVLPLVQEGRVSGSLIYIDDITEKRSREARLRRMENLASLTTVAAGVAHEIKNPLGSLSIHIQLIQKSIAADTKQYPPDQFKTINKYLDVVNEEIDRLNHIVVDFLFAVRPMDMEFKTGNLNALIKELVDFVAFELDAAQIEFRLMLEDTLADIEFDDRYIKQALLNLIKNAIAAMPQGGLLTITTQMHDTEVILTVSDTGIGIPEENMAKIFEPYFTTKTTGSGIGLTLVYKIIREHNGEIMVKSQLGEGSSFIITLPVPQKDCKLLPVLESNPV